MAAVTVHNDFGAQENKMFPCFLVTIKWFLKHLTLINLGVA